MALGHSYIFGQMGSLSDRRLIRIKTTIDSDRRGLNRNMTVLPETKNESLWPDEPDSTVHHKQQTCYKPTLFQ